MTPASEPAHYKKTTYARRRLSKETGQTSKDAAAPHMGRRVLVLMIALTEIAHLHGLQVF